MSARTSSVEITSDIVRAFAEALDNGFTGSLNDFANSADGQAAAVALADQKQAALRGERMGWARAVARDFKVNGKLTTYSKDRAIQLRDYLGTVNFDEVPDPETNETAETETASAE
jgi:hypothetical protein